MANFRALGPTTVRRLLVAATATWAVVLIGGGGVPLYDGIGFPDEPYRYVQPPHGYTQKHAPTTATVPVPVADGTNPHEGLISSSESGPQVSIYLPIKSLHVSDTQERRVIVRARPIAAIDPPTDGQMNSNVYAVDLGGATVKPGVTPPANVSLRQAVFETVLPVMEFRHLRADPWRRLQTSQIGRDIYLAPLAGDGQYVLVQPGAGTRQVRRDSGSRRQVVFIVGFCLLVVTGVLLAVRRLAPEGTPTEP